VAVGVGLLVNVVGESVKEVALLDLARSISMKVAKLATNTRATIKSDLRGIHTDHRAMDSYRATIGTYTE
jgi:hypothetical protein